jgi:polysaccharide pyruvyl transferase WcaK-like protein
VESISPTICLLGASFNTGNRGVAALAAGTITSVLSAIPDARVFLIDYAKVPSRHRVFCDGRHVEVELVNIRFSKKFWLPNNIARLLATALLLKLLPGSIQKRILAKNHHLNLLHQADVITSIAGGDSFSDIYGMARLLYVTLPQFLVIFLGRPLVQLPQTFGPYKSSAAKRIAGFIVRRSRAVYARDTDSLEEIKRLARENGAKYRFSPDMAFCMQPCPPKGTAQHFIADLRSKKNLVGLNVSGLLYIGGYNRSNMFGVSSDYAELTHRIIRFFLDQGCDVVLAPHVFGADDESDQTAIRAIASKFASDSDGRLHSVQGEFDQHEIKCLIGLCDFFLGARMHACIAALSQGVPAVGLAYSRKFVGVFRSVAVPELVLDLRSQTTEATLDQVAALYRDRAGFRSVLAKKSFEAREQVLGLFNSFPCFEAPESVDYQNCTNKDEKMLRFVHHPADKETA